MINFTKHRRFYLIFSASLALVSILSAIIFGLQLSRDFTGGSLLELNFKDYPRPDKSAVLESVNKLSLGKVDIQTTNENGLILKLGAINNGQKQAISLELAPDKDLTKIEVVRFDSVGPVVGQELKSKAWQAIVLASICIILYIAWAFRKVSRPVSSWKFGVTAVVTLLHDVLVVFGVFVILGELAQVEMDALFITALLTILGFSVHDTIVVFDRIRENLTRSYSDNFESCVNDSLNQTLARSINTSLTTLLVLLAILFESFFSPKPFYLAFLGSASKLFGALLIV